MIFIKIQYKEATRLIETNFTLNTLKTPLKGENNIFQIIGSFPNISNKFLI